MDTNVNTNINNQQIMLVNILNRMYNDNTNQINSLRYMLSNLMESNESIRTSITQILNNISQNENNDNLITNDNNNQIFNSINHMMNNPISNIRQPIPRRIRPLRQTQSRQNNTTFMNIYSSPSLNNLTNSALITEILNENQYTDIFDPVLIFPNQTQIELATRRIQYSDILNPLNTSCPISLEDFSANDIVVEIRYCGHIFRPQCILNWFRNNCRCPVCRYDIREYNSRLPNMFQENRNETQEETSSSQTGTETRTRTDPSNNVVNLTNDELFTIMINSLSRF
jgi:hypothetical protein